MHSPPLRVAIMRNWNEYRGKEGGGGEFHEASHARGNIPMGLPPLPAPAQDQKRVRATGLSTLKRKPQEDRLVIEFMKSVCGEVVQAFGVQLGRGCGS